MPPTARSWLDSLRSYTRPKLLVILFLGFSSGLPILLVNSTLSAWLGEVGVDKATIGLFAAVGTAYSFNFLWAPLVDHVRLPLLGVLGRRRSWMLLAQLVLFLAIAAMGLTDPAANPGLTALAAAFVAFASATQDIVVDAYRTDILDEEELGEGAAVGVFGYRMGMLVAGAGALYLAEFFGWRAAYAGMAGCVLVGMVTVLLAREPTPPDVETPDEEEGLAALLVERVQRAVVEPFADFMTKRGWWLLLFLVLFSKMADAFAVIMINPFLLETGFSKVQIAEISKVFGFLATTAGTVLGAALIRRFGIVRSLWICIPIQMLTNLVYIAQDRVGPEEWMLVCTISADNIAGGMAISAVIALMMQLCNARFTATQYALLASLASLGRTALSTGSGVVAEQGWATFFTVSALLGLPALVALALLPRFVDLQELEHRELEA